MLRPLECGDPIPEGCVVEAIGPWNGREMEVAYDPSRFDVAFARGGVVDDLEDRLAAGGWEYGGTDGRSSLWVRDRLAGARTQAHQPTPSAGRGLGGLSR